MLGYHGDFRRMPLLTVAMYLVTQAVSAGELSDEWLIRPGDGFGRIHGAPTYAEVKKLYPDLQVTIEKFYMWHQSPEKNSDPSDFPAENYFTFRKNGEILFRAECHCRLPDGKDVEEVQKLDAKNVFDKRILNLIIISPKFRTKEGIHVGSRIRDLRRAYPHTPGLFAIRGFTEHACTGSKAAFRWGKLRDGKAAAYFLMAAPGKKYAGTYVNHDYTKKIDDNAVVIAIDPRGGCIFPEGDG